LTVRTAQSTSSKFLVNLGRFREAGLAIFILLLIAAISIRSPFFLTVNNFREILMNISILVIVGLAQSIVIISHGIDLSVSSIIALVAMMVAFFVKLNPSMGMIFTILLGIGLGGILGLINGLLITFGRVPPIITTLGTLSIYRGLVFFYSEGAWVNSFELPESFKQVAKGTPLGLPNLILFAIVATIIAYYFLNFTRMGRDIFALGDNFEAAQMAGIRTHRISTLVYVISGLACGLAAVLWASRYESAQTNTAVGFELQTVAASIVGGVSISGGIGTVPGVVLGAFLLGIIENALTIIGISPFWQLAAQGLLILIAVVVDHLILRGVRESPQG
jgi:rhamnose transport system permease protein